jgi:hypothetical protein
VLDAQLRAHVALNAPEHVFIHAAVVAARGRAIVIPGPSFSGKTTLAAALLAAGCTYYSDEFAALDPDGLVHPYPKPLSIRAAGSRHSTERSPATLGAQAGSRALPIGLIAITRYLPAAVWRPRRQSAGEASLALLANAVPARERPAETLAAITNAVAGALTLKSDRGEATTAAREIIATATATRSQLRGAAQWP